MSPDRLPDHIKELLRRRNAGELTAEQFEAECIKAADEARAWAESRRITSHLDPRRDGFDY